MPRRRHGGQALSEQPAGIAAALLVGEGHHLADAAQGQPSAAHVGRVRMDRQRRSKLAMLEEAEQLGQVGRLHPPAAVLEVGVKGVDLQHCERIALRLARRADRNSMFVTCGHDAQSTSTSHLAGLMCHGRLRL